MRRMLLTITVLLAACGSDSPMDEDDVQACGTYEQSVAAAEAGDETQMLTMLEDASAQAESSRLSGLLDGLRTGMEEDGDVDQDTVNAIRSWCGIS